ncbi:hypothetical protein L1887_62518 [Cichorium endivia]|nr:hypothetical protein L1887_62518 [Cichorium endivia]
MGGEREGERVCVLPKVGRVEQAAALLFSLPLFFSLNRLEKFGSVAAAFCGHPTKNSSPRDPECIGDITIAVEADLICASHCAAASACLCLHGSQAECALSRRHLRCLAIQRLSDEECSPLLSLG